MAIKIEKTGPATYHFELDGWHAAVFYGVRIGVSILMIRLILAW